MRTALLGRLLDARGQTGHDECREALSAFEQSIIDSGITISKPEQPRCVIEDNIKKSNVFLLVGRFFYFFSSRMSFKLSTLHIASSERSSCVLIR